MQNTQINNTKETKAEEFKTGTTTVGLTTEDGVILAADRRASMGHLTSSKKAKKIYELDDNIGLTIAGSVGDAQQIVRMRSQLKLHKLETRELTVKGASTLLSNILHGSKMMPYMNQFVLGGRDSQENGMLYTLDPAGGLMKHDRFTTTGSGSQMAYGVFEDNYEEGMDHEEAKELATRAVQAAMERDTASGNGIMVTEITEDGFNILEEKEVEKRLE